jgi:two-component system KDP operon response regulator KdpE
MLTAKARESEMLRGFEVGADDYLTKPFSAKELVARIRAVLRRAVRSAETTVATLHCGELEIDFARRSVGVRGKVVQLTRTEYAVLRELALHANRVVLHGDLLASVWGPEYRNELDYLRAYIRHLRQKLEADSAQPQYILTSQGVGYMLACPEEGQVHGKVVD